MADRREFLQGAAALSAAPLAGRVAFAGTTTPEAYDAIVFDARHSSARLFGERMRDTGLPVRAIEGDITALWRDELEPVWRQSPRAIAGLTERPALFLLERLGWDHDLKVVFEAQHEPQTAGTARHRIVRSSASGLAHELESAAAGWPVALADMLVVGSGVRKRDFSPSGAALAAYHGEPTKLYSWIIAPRSAA